MHALLSICFGFLDGCVHGRAGVLVPSEYALLHAEVKDTDLWVQVKPICEKSL